MIKKLCAALANFFCRLRNDLSMLDHGPQMQAIKIEAPRSPHQRHCERTREFERSSR